MLLITSALQLQVRVKTFLGNDKNVEMDDVILQKKYRNKKKLQLLICNTNLLSEIKLSLANVSTSSNG